MIIEMLGGEEEYCHLMRKLYTQVAEKLGQKESETGFRSFCAGFAHGYEFEKFANNPNKEQIQ